MKYVNGEKDMFEWEENRRSEQKMEWHSTYNICENCYKPRKKRDDWYEEDEDF